VSYHQYLDRYAEPEALALSAWLQAHAPGLPRGRTLAAIPLCREADLISGLVASLQTASERFPAVVIFNVNHRSGAADEIKQDNRETLRFLRSLYRAEPQQIAPGICLGDVSGSLSVLLVDRCAPGLELPERQGVGLARKIGCDLACVLTYTAGITADTFIRNTDGDARVGDDFFLPITEPGLAAALMPFRHEPKQDGINAVLRYEQYLHYYVRGLRFAGSDYAFHTVGSTIACEVSAYVSCRGFPKREAGEDFYLLNKLAKVGAVREIARKPLTLVARDSDRVPFGTGASCRKIEGMLLSGGSYEVYHPDCFRLLALWLQAARAALDSAGVPAAWSGFTAAAKTLPAVTAIGMEQIEAALDLCAGLQEVLAKSPDHGKRARHLRTWFDGFRTMRFLNLARDHFFGVVPVSEAAEEFLPAVAHPAG
jgi:hypothetical protein